MAAEFFSVSLCYHLVIVGVFTKHWLWELQQMCILEVCYVLLGLTMILIIEKFTFLSTIFLMEGNVVNYVDMWKIWMNFIGHDDKFFKKIIMTMGDFTLPRVRDPPNVIISWQSHLLEAQRRNKEESAIPHINFTNRRNYLKKWSWPEMWENVLVILEFMLSKIERTLAY